MTRAEPSGIGEVRIRPWADGDLALLRSANTLAMTTHIGGPETELAIEERHARYLRMWRNHEAHMFAIVEASTADPNGVGVGGVGWWPTRWHEDDVYESGWHVLPEAQGRGIAHAAVSLTIADARLRGDRRLLTAFPHIDNTASNRLCASLGFIHRGVETFPFRGTTLIVNAWALDLTS